MKMAFVKSRRKTKASNFSGGRTLRFIYGPHLVGCARGFADLILKISHVQFSGLSLKTISGRFDRFGSQNRGDKSEDVLYNDEWRWQRVQTCWVFHPKPMPMKVKCTR